MKKYKVVAKNEIMDAEINVDDYCYDAVAIFNDFKNSGLYTQVYIMDNETGELYRTFDVQADGTGITLVQWAKVF